MGHQGWIFGRCWRAVSGALVVGAVLFSATTALRSQDAPAYNYRVLYTFGGAADGGSPTSGLVFDWEGNLYGSAVLGGDLSVSCDYGEPNAGCGAVYKLDPYGKETVLYAFTGGADGGTLDGLSPTLVRDAAGNLYGTMGTGGDLSACGGIGCGLVFKLDPRGKETVLYAFKGEADGQPNGYAPPLIRDEAGNLYGTTYLGGDLSACYVEQGGLGCGVVYKVDHAGKETVLYAFKGTPDGEDPGTFGALLRDEAGNLYGTTAGGGNSGWGTVFKLNRAGQETVLYSFTGGADGGEPAGGLVRDQEGNLYGTTGEGGEFGWGVAYKLDPTGTETVLHTFTGGADGAYPYAGLVRDAKGNLYGTTLLAGEIFLGGVVYMLDPAGNETVLHNFTGGADGAFPYATLVLDEAGNLYGTTSSGGDLTSLNAACAGYGCGVVFELKRVEAGSH